MTHRILTGVKPTGDMPHFGNLFGAILPFQKLAEHKEAFIFIADLHALTSVFDRATLEKNTKNLIASYLAILGENTPITIFRQSDIHQITRLQWILNNVTPYSLMLRAHSFKDAEAKNADINMGVFNYPILMAADIIGYDIDIVPVGRDQIQHLEMSRDIARAFNKATKSQTFKEPKAFVDESVAIIPGLDGRKMSKSYQNFIGIFEESATLKKKIMAIETDSRGVNDKKDPETCKIFALYQLFATPQEIETLRWKYCSENANFGYGHAKLELLAVAERCIAPYREAQKHILANWNIAEQKLAAGAQKMNTILDTKMAHIRNLIGV